MDAALAGFLLGLGLILPIGAQNAFVLRQGLCREHVFWICLTCALSDAVLIGAGVSGSAALAGRLPWAAEVLRWGGAAFLFTFGARSFLSAWRGGAALSAARQGPAGLGTALLTCLLLTWANPHVYLDVLVLTGAGAAGFPGAEAAFALGAIAASFLYFFALGYGARALAPLFARPAAWRVVDLSVGLVMWTIALRLAVSA